MDGAPIGRSIQVMPRCCPEAPHPHPYSSPVQASLHQYLPCSIQAHRPPPHQGVDDRPKAMSRTSPSATASIWSHHRAQSQFRLGTNGPEPAHVYRCLVLASRSSVLMTCTPRPPLHPLSALVCYPTSVSSAPSMLATPHSQLRFCIGGDVNSSDCGETGRQCPPVGGLSKDGYAQGPKGP